MSSRSASFFAILGKVIKIGFIASLILFITLWGLLFSFYLWVKAEPRELDVVRNKIEEELRDFDESMKITIGQSIISWDEASDKLKLSIKGVKALDSEEVEVVNIQDISAMIDIKKLLWFDRNVVDLAITNPYVVIHQKQQVVRDDTGKETSEYLEFNQERVIENIGQFIYDNATMPLNSAIVTNAKIVINKKGKEYILDIPIAKSELNVDEHKHTTLDTLIDGTFNGKPLTLSLNSSKSGALEARVRLNFVNLQSAMILDFIPSDKIPTSLADGKTYVTGSGYVELEVKRGGRLDKLSLGFKKMNGNIHLPEYLNQDISLYDLHTNMELDLTKEKGKLHDLALYLRKDLVIKLDGDFALDFGKTDLKLEVIGAGYQDVINYWPKGQAEDAYEWIKNNISKGKFTSANGHVKISKNTIDSKGELTKDALDLVVEIQDVSMTAEKNFPLISDVSGKIRIYGDHIIVEDAKGSTVQNKIVRAKAVIPFSDKGVIKVDGEAQGEIGAARGYIPANVLAEVKKAGFDLANLKGSGKTQFALELPYEGELTLDNLKLDVRFEGKGMSFAQILSRYDLSNSQVTFMMKGRDLGVKGSGLIAKNNVEFDFTGKIGEDDRFSGSGKISGKIGVGAEKELKLSDVFAISKGSAGALLNIDIKGEDVDLKVSSDLKNAEVFIIPFNYLKALNSDGKLSLDLKLNDDQITISNLNLSGSGFAVKGKIVANDNFSTIKLANLSEVKIGKNDFAVDFSRSPNKLVANISGSELDYAGFIDSVKADNTSSKLPSEFDIAIKVNKIYMKNKVVFSGVDAEFACGATSCTKGNFNATMNGNVPVTLSSAAEGGALLMKLSTKDAGLFSNGFDIYSDITDGVLIGSAYLSKGAEGPSVTRGSVSITDFRAVKTPLLAKLFTLTSVQGLIDVLRGEEISFDKFYTNFDFVANILTLKNGEAKSSSIGLTLEGTINYNSKYVKLKGNLIPEVLGVNKLVGSVGNVIPFVPNILGGKSGNLIAFNYKLEGPFGKVDASVNPLSGLTPGIFREVFK